MANSVDPDQTAPIGAFYSESTLFVSILNSPEMLDDIFRCIFGALRVYRISPTLHLRRYIGQIPWPFPCVKRSLETFCPHTMGKSEKGNN